MAESITFSIEESRGTRQIIRYVPRPDATSDAEVETLARIYDFVIGAYKSRETARIADRDEGEEEDGQGHTEGHALLKGKL